MLASDPDFDLETIDEPKYSSKSSYLECSQERKPQKFDLINSTDMSVGTGVGTGVGTVLYVLFVLFILCLIWNWIKRASQSCGKKAVANPNLSLQPTMSNLPKLLSDLRKTVNLQTLSRQQQIVLDPQNISNWQQVSRIPPVFLYTDPKTNASWNLSLDPQTNQWKLINSVSNSSSNPSFNDSDYSYGYSNPYLFPSIYSYSDYCYAGSPNWPDCSYYYNYNYSNNYYYPRYGGYDNGWNRDWNSDWNRDWNRDWNQNWNKDWNRNWNQNGNGYSHNQFYSGDNRGYGENHEGGGYGSHGDGGYGNSHEDGHGGK
jgi:hypothetical protein